MTSLFHYEPFYDFDRFFDTFGHITRPSESRSLQSINDAARPTKPRMDLHENPETNSVTATFELPGLRKEDVQIDVHDGRLSVSGESRMSAEHEESGYAVRERRYGKFARTLQLPQGVQDDEIKAAMDNGVLTVTFPKSAPEAAPKRIAIA